MVKSSKPNKVVLFDIDFTLFDTEAFRDKMYRSILKSTSFRDTEHKQLIQRVYEGIVSEFGYFTPRIFLERMVKLFPSGVDVIEKAIWDKANFKGNFYDEIQKVLEVISKFALVGIFSKGFSKRWQKRKLSEIKHFFVKDNIHITINKHSMLPGILKKYSTKKLYLVDDALDILQAAKILRSGIYTIWVKRGKYAMVQKPIPGFEPDATVADLKDVVDIVEKDS